MKVSSRNQAYEASEAYESAARMLDLCAEDLDGIYLSLSSRHDDRWRIARIREDVKSLKADMFRNADNVLQLDLPLDTSHNDQDAAI